MKLLNRDNQEEIIIVAMLATRGCISHHSDYGSLVPAKKIRLRREAERIIQCKGHISCLENGPGVHRVWPPDDECPRLAMSRAFGDYCVKDYGLISVPEVTQRHISRGQFFALATDGVCIMHHYTTICYGPVVRHW